MTNSLDGGIVLAPIVLMMIHFALGKEHVEVHRVRKQEPNEGIDVACGQWTRIKGRH
jgi:hypothetical protein